jgi:hypothetical protein
MDQNHTCPYCGATKTIAKGFRYNKAGPVLLRRCKSCGRRWTAQTEGDEARRDGTPTTGKTSQPAKASPTEDPGKNAETVPHPSPESDTWG